MYEKRQQNCIFCARHGQPASLFETLHFSVMPDKFPLLPGHVLVISEEHRRCHAEASTEELRALDAVVCRARRFLDESYGQPVYISESGVARQCVFHAHLHLVPFPVRDLPDVISEYEGVTPVDDGAAVRSYFAGHGHHWYVELGKKRYIADPRGPGLQSTRCAPSERARLAILGRRVEDNQT